MTDKLTATRQFRRLRSQFKRDLGIKNLTRADRVLIDQASLLALRAQQMRDQILSGENLVDDEDLVRLANGCIRTMAAIRNRKDRDQPRRETMRERILREKREEQERKPH